jgi:Spy/CpxP family protein refolding chaperone
MKRAGKVSLLLVLALLLSLGLTASVWAQPTKQGLKDMNMTPEQAAKIFDLMEKLHADTVSLRKQIFVKAAELESLMKSKEPDKNAIEAKKKELNALNDQFREKMTAFLLKAKKIAPNFNLGLHPIKVRPPSPSAPAK